MELTAALRLPHIIFGENIRYTFAIYFFKIIPEIFGRNI